MRLRPASFAVLAMAAGSVAAAAAKRDPNVPYRPVPRAFMSNRQLFGISPRDAGDGYQPGREACKEGKTCEEACGKGYSECAAKNGEIHCFNLGDNEICCPNGNGDSCEAGFWCAEDGAGGTWCCPAALSLQECAEKYKVGGSLASQMAPGASSSTDSSTSTTETASVVTAETTATVSPQPTSSTSRSLAAASKTTTPTSSTNAAVAMPTAMGVAHAAAGIAAVVLAGVL